MVYLAERQLPLLTILELERFIGAQIFGNVSPYFSFYADICDYSSSTQLSNESYLNQSVELIISGTMTSVKCEVVF